MTTFSGHHYDIRMHAHHANWLFYSKKVFDGLHLSPPITVDERSGNVGEMSCPAWLLQVQLSREA